MNLQKAIQLAKLAPSRPVEAWDRIMTVLEVHLDNGVIHPGTYRPTTWEQLINGLDRSVNTRCSEFAEELALKRIESEIVSRQLARANETPFDTSHDGDVWLGRLCYVLTRASRPETVVETGVAYGVTSAYILQALKINDHGRLHSIDLPPLTEHADQHIGMLIPENVKDRWDLRRGPSKRLLKPLVEQLGRVDLFVHDSLHTYKTMTMEFETVAPHLQPSAIVIADDVHGNRAFADWCATRSHRLSEVLEENTKESLLGIWVG